MTREGVPFAVDIFDDFLTVRGRRLFRIASPVLLSIPARIALLQPSECDHFIELAKVATMRRSTVRPAWIQNCP